MSELQGGLEMSIPTYYILTVIGNHHVQYRSPNVNIVFCLLDISYQDKEIGCQPILVFNLIFNLYTVMQCNDLFLHANLFHI